MGLLFHFSVMATGSALQHFRKSIANTSTGHCVLQRQAEDQVLSLRPVPASHWGCICRDRGLRCFTSGHTESAAMTEAPRLKLTTPACKRFMALPHLSRAMIRCQCNMTICQSLDPPLAIGPPGTHEHDQGPRHSKLTAVTFCLHLFSAYSCKLTSFPSLRCDAIHTWAIDPLIDFLP